MFRIETHLEAKHGIRCRDDPDRWQPPPMPRRESIGEEGDTVSEASTVTTPELVREILSNARIRRDIYQRTGVRMPPGVALPELGPPPPKEDGSARGPKRRRRETL